MSFWSARSGRGQIRTHFGVDTGIQCGQWPGLSLANDFLSVFGGLVWNSLMELKSGHRLSWAGYGQRAAPSGSLISITLWLCFPGGMLLPRCSYPLKTLPVYRSLFTIIQWLYNSSFEQHEDPTMQKEILSWSDSREVRCVIHTTMIESSITCLREAVCVRMNSYFTIASGWP